MNFYSFYHRHQKIIHHLTGWICFIVYEQSNAWLTSGQWNSVVNFLYFYGCNISLFYVVTAILDYTIARGKPNYSMAALLIATALILFLFIKSVREYYLFLTPSHLSSGLILFRRWLIMDLYRNMYYAGLSLVVWSAGHIAHFRKQAAEAEIVQLRADRRNAELETTLARTKYAYLQQQLNPHLLFNTLSFIYSSVYRHSADGAKAVLLLSDIMRFSLEEMDSEGKVPLADEVQQVKNLILLNSYRCDYPLWLNLKIEGKMTEYRIIPLILLTLTENILKHGDLRQGGAEILLTIKPGGALSFCIKNRVNLKSTQHRRHAIGLENTRLRLDYAYGKNYQIDIKETDDLYELMLTLQL